VDDALHDARVVAQVDEGEVLAVLAAAGDPAAHGDAASLVCLRQLAAMVGAHGHASLFLTCSTMVVRSTVSASPFSLSVRSSMPAPKPMPGVAGPPSSSASLS